MTTRKRIMREFTISEISAVDRPAQTHAVKTLMKRADKQEHDDMQIQKIDNDEVASFDTLDEAVRHLEKLHPSRSAAMSAAAERYPELVKRFNSEGVEIAKAAADALAPRSITKAEQDFELAVDEIVKRDKCPRSDAMSKARTEHPDAFRAYQGA
jgi:hypothetical protein